MTHTTVNMAQLLEHTEATLDALAEDEETEGELEDEGGAA
jgi:hypothetical protein